MVNEQQPLDYEAVLADLEAKKAAIEGAILALRQVINLGTQVTPPIAGATGRMFDPSQIADDAFFGLSIGEAAKKYLSMVKRKQSVREIADALDRGGLHHTSGDFTNTVATMLRRQSVKDTELARVGRGDWGLAAWYGNRRPTQSRHTPRAAKSKRSHGKSKPGRSTAKDAAAAPTTTSMAEQILRSHGRPMTVDEIIIGIRQRFGRDVLKDTLVGNLSRKIAKGDTFVRPAISTYGLREHGSAV